MKPRRLDTPTFRVTGSTVAPGAAMAWHREEPDESYGRLGALATMHPGLDDAADPKEVDTSVAACLWFNPAFAVRDSKGAEVDILRRLKAPAAGDKLVPGPVP